VTLAGVTLSAVAAVAIVWFALARLRAPALIANILMVVAGLLAASVCAWFFT
jgi:hypothetical protein